MKMPEAVKSAIARAKLAYVASAGKDGRPHLAVSDRVAAADDEHVVFTAWFCPQTVENVGRNPRVSVALWDAKSEKGYQLIGTVVSTDVQAVLDGYAGPKLEKPGMPQVQRQLRVRVEQILDFCAGPHSDSSTGPPR